MVLFWTVELEAGLYSIVPLRFQVESNGFS